MSLRCSRWFNRYPAGRVRERLATPFRVHGCFDVLETLGHDTIGAMPKCVCFVDLAVGARKSWFAFAPIPLVVLEVVVHLRSRVHIRQS